MEVLRKYNVQKTIYFPLIETGGEDYTVAAVHVAGDSQRSLDGAVFGNTAAGFVNEGNGVYSILVGAAELQSEITVITVIDQTPAKVWQDQTIIIQTYGNPAASFAFDLDTATVVASSVAAGGIVAASFGAGAIDAAAIAADAIGAAEIAADAIGSSELATSAITEIADGVWDEARAGHVAGGSFGEGVASVVGNVGGNIVGTVASVVGNVGGNVVGTVASVVGNVGGNVVGSVGSIAAAGIAAASYTAGALAAIADAMLDEVYEGVETFREFLRVVRAALLGKLSGGGTFTLRFRNRADTRDRIVATVDAVEDRTNIVTDVLP